MIPLAMCNSGEDFVIKKYRQTMEIMTSDNRLISLDDLVGVPLSIVGNDGNTVYAVFQGHRLAFKKEFARLLQGVIIGKTKEKPEILTAPTDCVHDCSKCKGCGGH